MSLIENRVLENLSEEDTQNTYLVQISKELDDAKWDEFVKQVPEGHHVQSSLWSRLKTMHNWHPLRVMILRDNEIIAGVQMLLKKIPLLGQAGYITQGPVLSSYESQDCECILAAIDESMKKEGIRILFILPNRDGLPLEQHLNARGAVLQDDIRIGPEATTMVDLEQDLDTIQANMKSKTRYNVRYAARKEIVVREGTIDDLPTFHTLLQKTAARNEFSPYSLEYFEQMYHLFTPHQHFKLLFAEHEGEILSAILLIAFSDTVIYKKGAWSGAKGNLRPNEALHWEAIKWAKTQGYRYYDFEGISRVAAQSVIAGEGIPDEAMNTYTRFKLGFGGEIRLLPHTFIYSRNPVIRWFSRQSRLIAMLGEIARIIRRR